MDAALCQYFALFFPGRDGWPRHRGMAWPGRSKGLLSEAHHADLGTDDNVNGSERAGHGHDPGLVRRLVTTGGGV